MEGVRAVGALTSSRASTASASPEREEWSVVVAEVADLGSTRDSNNDGTAGFAAAVLAGYLERPAGKDEAMRLRLLTWLYDYVCLLWSELYLIQRAGAPGGEVSTRAELLALRLIHGAGGRQTQDPAH